MDLTTHEKSNASGLSGNMLKMIAALSMLIDHIGVVLFPHITILRVIGRIAFPVFAFMIAEGCAYTKNRLQYFLTVFLLGAGCQIVYYLNNGQTRLGSLISFSLGILVVYALQYLKNTIYAAESSALNRCAASVVFLSTVACVYFLNKYFRIDYGFWGCMAPAFASVFKTPRTKTLALQTVWERLDRHALHVFMFCLCLIFVSCASGGKQWYSLLSVPFLLVYSGKRGKLNMKYFFYTFYPAHLIILYCISYFLK